jgi:hypothetical protein
MQKKAQGPRNERNGNSTCGCIERVDGRKGREAGKGKGGKGLRIGSSELSATSFYISFNLKLTK